MQKIKTKFSRRRFLAQMSAGTLSVPFLIKLLENELFAKSDKVQRSLIWFRGTSSGINEIGKFNNREFETHLSNYFTVIDSDRSDFDAIIENHSTSSILILEGSFEKQHGLNIENKLIKLMNSAKVILLLGNSASYNTPNSDNFFNLEDEFLDHIETPFIRLPGQPVSFRHLLGVLNYLVLYGIPDLDELRRPLMFYSTSICNRCEYRGDFESGRFVEFYGEREGCLYLLGCKGVTTNNSCPIDKWNGTTNWCVGAGSPCVGCSEPKYPDHYGLGLYGQLTPTSARVNSFFVRNTEKIALGSVAIAAGGIIAHAITQRSPKEVDLQTPYAHPEGCDQCPETFGDDCCLVCPFYRREDS